MNSNPVLCLLNAIGRDGDEIAVVYFSDFYVRDTLVEEVKSLLPANQNIVEVDRVEEAIKCPETKVLFLSKDKRDTIKDWEGCREHLLSRHEDAIVILFLMRDGDGQAELSQSPGLASWIRASEADPDLIAKIDEQKEIAEFVKGNTLILSGPLGESH